MKKGPRKSSEKTPLLDSVTPTFIIPRTNASDDLRLPAAQMLTTDPLNDTTTSLLEESKKKTCLIS